MNEPLLAAQRNRMSTYNSATDSVQLLQDTSKMATTTASEDQRQLSSSYRQGSLDEESLRRRTASSPVSSRSDTDDFINIEVREGEAGSGWGGRN